MIAGIGNIGTTSQVSLHIAKEAESTTARFPAPS